MNSKIKLILLIVINLLLAALVSRNGAIALMAVPFLVYLGTGFLSSPGEIRLRASRVMSCMRCTEDKPFEMLLTIENDGPAIPLLRIVEPIQARLRLVEGSSKQCFTLTTGEKIELASTFQAPRGRYEWQTVKLVASDPFGLFEKSLEIKTEAHTLVLPEYLKIRHFRFRPQPTVRTTGPNLSRLPGPGIDFLGVRQYRPGDSLRMIHWRMSARHPHSFFSKEYEREEIADIGLLLDARAIVNPTNGAEDLLKYSIQATTSLAEYFLSSGNRVSLLVLSDRLMRVFPGYGKHQLVRILDQLADCTTGEKVTLETLKYLPASLFPRQSLIVIISPLFPGDFNTLQRIKAEGYQILLVCPNPIQWSKMVHSTSSFGSFAIRAAALERKAQLLRIQKMGIQTIDWQVDSSLISTLRSARFMKM